MSDINTENIDKLLEEIGDALLLSISYKRYPSNQLIDLIKSIDLLTSDMELMKECENYFRTPGSNYVLFFLSNILYNLKRKGELVLTPDVFKWLGSVWKNFLNRNLNYQEFINFSTTIRKEISEFYPSDSGFINKISNAHMVNDVYLSNSDKELNKVRILEDFYRNTLEVLNAMKPTYFFLLDYYYERRISTGENEEAATQLEVKGLSGFGDMGYTYEDILIILCKTLGILEAVYLLLKKKKSNRILFSINGKQKLLSTSEIYAFYLDKFDSTKKELVTILTKK